LSLNLKSYTDENRLRYFQNNNGSAPPAGLLLPSSDSTASGGKSWARYAAIASGAKLYNYAVSGAVCSNAMISRYLSSIRAPFPDVLGYEIPAFIADANFVNKTTGTNTLYIDRQSDNTVYAIWIGTNDLGGGALIQDYNVRGTNITTFTECVFESFDAIYAAGGRNFILINTAPLQLSPLYGTPEAGGLASSKFWLDKPANITETSYKMLEYTTAVNQIWAYQVPYSLHIAHRYPGASMAIFDVHSLLTDIYHNPTAYLSGANVTSSYRVCTPDRSVCTTGPGGLDGFMWYDELHPSNKTDQAIATEFLKVVDGTSKYGTYW